MKKYKLLKNYPPYKKGDILIENGTSGYSKSNWDWPVKYAIIEKYPDWFASYVFTTEDGVDIYLDEPYYFIFDCDGTVGKGRAVTTDATKFNNRFSTKEVAEKHMENKDTSMILIYNGDDIELHFEGDIYFPLYDKSILYDLLARKVDLVAYSNEFKKLKDEKKRESKKNA